MKRFQNSVVLAFLLLSSLTPLPKLYADQLADLNKQIHDQDVALETLSTTYKTTVAAKQLAIQNLQVDLANLSVKYTTDRRAILDIRDPLVQQRNALIGGTASSPECAAAKKAVFDKNQEITDFKQTYANNKSAARADFKKNYGDPYHAKVDPALVNFRTARVTYLRDTGTIQGKINSDTNLLNSCKSTIISGGGVYDPTQNCLTEQANLTKDKSDMADAKLTYQTASNTYNEILLPAQIDLSAGKSGLDATLNTIDTNFQTGLNTKTDELQTLQTTKFNACGN